MFNKLKDSQLSSGERRAFERLTKTLGFTPHAIFGLDGDARNLAVRYDNGKVGTQHIVYALAAANPTRTRETSSGVLEYRLLVAVVQQKAAPTPPRGDSDDTVLLRGPHGMRRMSRARMRRGAKQSWVTRRRRYGAKGMKPKGEASPAGL